jgi:hypothetical protein
MEAIYSLDRCAVVRKSHENPAIVDLFERYLGPGFGSELALETLHVEHPHPPAAAGSDQPPPPVFPPKLATEKEEEEKVEVEVEEGTKHLECSSCGMRYLAPESDASTTA